MVNNRIQLLVIFSVLVLLNLFMWPSFHDSAATIALAAGVAQQENTSTAAVPNVFSYQGSLTGADGAPLTDSLDMTLQIYDVPTGGEPLYAHTYDSVPVRNGAFGLIIGEDEVNNPLPPDIFSIFPLYLGIAIDQDPEMLPRQRLHPVPWAMQASTAFNAVTADGLSRGAAMEGVLEIGQGGGKNIAFDRTDDDGTDAGIISYDTSSLSINGAGAQGEQTVTLSDNVTVTGDVAVGGDLSVEGEWNAKAIHHIGDSNVAATAPVATSEYDVSLKRFVIEASDAGSAPDSVPIDDEILTQLCGDIDGCSIRLGMRDWVAGAAPGLVSLQGPFQFSLAQGVVGGRLWGLHAGTGQVSLGADGDGIHDNIVNAWDCYLSDGTTESGQSTGDSDEGFALVNWFGTFDSLGMNCVLVIDD